LKVPALHFNITGHVQGVGFRYAMCGEARRLRLTGWVRNCTNGSVEAVAVGDQVALQRLAQWARRGPPGSRVENVQVSAATDVQAADVNDPFNQRSDRY
jgi:acylphosphatase